MAETEYSIQIAERKNKISLRLHYNESNSFWCVNGINIFQSKAKKFVKQLVQVIFQRILQLII